MPTTHFTRHRIIQIFTVLAAITLFVGIGFTFHTVSGHVLEYIASRDEALLLYTQEHFTQALLLFALAYFVVATIALPLESALSVVAGYYFGTMVGTGIVAVAATLGSLTAFLLIKYYLHDWFHRVVRNNRVQSIIGGLNKDPLSYLILLRWAPLLPHFVINVSLSFSKATTRQFILGTFVGVLPSTFVFVLAGTQLATIRETGKVLTPGTTAILFLMALFSLVPLLAKRYLQKNQTILQDAVASLSDDVRQSATHDK